MCWGVLILILINNHIILNKTRSPELALYIFYYLNTKPCNLLKLIVLFLYTYNSPNLFNYNPQYFILNLCQLWKKPNDCWTKTRRTSKSCHCRRRDITGKEPIQIQLPITILISKYTIVVQINVFLILIIHCFFKKVQVAPRLKIGQYCIQT